MKKFRGIYKSFIEPQDKELIWYHLETEQLLYYTEGDWIPLIKLDGTAITIEGKNLVEIYHEVNEALGNIRAGITTVKTIEELESIQDPEVGDPAYVEETKELYIYSADGIWENNFVTTPNTSVVVSSEPPEDEDALWIDPDGDGTAYEDKTISALREEIAYLRKKVDALNSLLMYGAIAGNAAIGGRTQVMSTSNKQIKPEASTSDIEDSEEYEEPIVPDEARTIPNISIKMDTSANFTSNKNNLIDGEPIFITDLLSFAIYYKGSFIINSGNNSGNIDMSTPVDKDEIKEILGEMTLDSIQFKSLNGDTYAMEIDESGNLHWYKNANYDGVIGSPKSYGSYINDYLKINSVFIGGVGTKLNSFCACSHNYVELANGSTTDVNLNGIYLLYKGPDKTSWSSIALKGIIKAGSTFLIRGNRCSYSSNVTIDIVDFDQEWFVDGSLIEFEEGGGTFYLVCSQEGKFHNGTDWVTLDKIGTLNPYLDSNPPVGYIDLLGILGNKGGTVMAEGGSPITIKATEDIKKCIFTRAFTLDPCSQAQKAYTSKKSSTLCSYINMNTVGTEYYPYYTDKEKFKYQVKASKDNKNIYGTRTTFDEKEPNAVNIAFGIQATDNGDGATKCFNWISVGSYDEYLEFGLLDDAETTKMKSIDESTLDEYYADDSNVREFIDIYKRLHWLTTNNTAVTSHKVILRGLKAGKYKYKIGREGDSAYSKSGYFTVRTDAEVNESFEFAHTTDQQAFNFYEYQAWTKAALAIDKTHPEIHFTINTGDATQNGNRESEWLDYFNGRKYLDGKEEMYTIGNNDLCGIIPYELGDGTAATYKINHKNFIYYFCYELDSQNPAIFKFVDSGLNEEYKGDVLEFGGDYFTYYMPSLYSFNYGKYHFVSLNSEFAAKTYRVYYDDANKETSFKAHAYYNMYRWMAKDYALHGELRNNIAFMHEIPFCITVGSSTTGVATARTISSGSKLNEDFSAGIAKTNVTDDSAKYTGGCCFSEFFQTNGYKLALGGHKHTYSLSYPTTEKIVEKEGVRSVEYNDPEINKDNGVIYSMSQATGYKLVSNKELPGSGISWLRKYFPATSNGTSLSANEAQYYPMYGYYKAAGDTLIGQSYVVANIYTRNSKNSPVAFDINNQSTSFRTENSKMIENTEIQIDY